MVEFQCPELILGMLKDNFNKEDTSDVVISLSNGDRIHCHRAVLSMGSPVFHRMFESGMKETTAAEVVLDGEPKAIKCLLGFLYSGECSINEDNFAAITAVADCYDVQLLHKLCLLYMEKHFEVNSGNCVKLLTSSFKHKVERAFAIAAKYLIKHGTTSEEIEGFPYPLMESIVEQGKEYSGSNANLVSIIYRWTNCSLSDRKSLGVTLLLDVNLSTLSLNELATACSLSIIQETPALQSAVVKAISSKTRDVSVREAGHSSSKIPVFPSRNRDYA